MKRSPADIIDAMKAAYRPDAPATLELMPGDHAAIAKLEEQDKWLSTIRRWLQANRTAKHSFDAFVGDEKAKTEGEAP
jgi:hypothetical protein